MPKKYFYFLILHIFIVFKAQSDDFINIYVLNINLKTLKHHQISILKKYYNEFYLYHKNYHSRSKEESIFIVQPLNPMEKNTKLKELNFYQYLLTNLIFDYVHFFDLDINFDIKNSSSKYTEYLKKNINKILCFNCFEKYSYLYQKFIFRSYNNLKIGFILFKNCNFSIKELEKLLYLYEDTNLWILSFAKEQCLKENYINILNKFNSVFLIFNSGKNRFYKYNKHIYNCFFDNVICYVKIKFREGNFINLENQFIKIYNYE